MQIVKENSRNQQKKWQNRQGGWWKVWSTVNRKRLIEIKYFIFKEIDSQSNWASIERD